MPLHSINRVLRSIGFHTSPRRHSGGKTSSGRCYTPCQIESVSPLLCSFVTTAHNSRRSEWAHFRGNVPNGFSGRGGQTSSAYFPLGDPSGSSSGSAVGTSIGLGAASLGSETDGSIVSPSSRNNLVGIKPTVGLTSRAGGRWFTRY